VNACGGWASSPSMATAASNGSAAFTTNGNGYHHHQGSNRCLPGADGEQQQHMYTQNYASFDHKRYLRSIDAIGGGGGFGGGGSGGCITSSMMEFGVPAQYILLDRQK